MRENKICIIKVCDDDFILIDEIHKELNAENLLLFFTKEKILTNDKLKQLIEKEMIKIIVIPYFYEDTEYKKLTSDIKVPIISYNQILDGKKTLVITKANRIFDKKNVYFEKAIKLNYDFLYRIRTKYDKIEKIMSTFYLTDIFIEKIENIMNSKVYNINKILLRNLTKYLQQNQLNNLEKENGSIEFEEF